MEKSARTPLQQEIVSALVESQAIDLVKISEIFGRFGGKAALEGETFATVITKHVMWNCGWPVPEVFHGLQDVAGQ